MIAGQYVRERGIPPRLPQDVIDEIASRPRDRICHAGTPTLNEFLNSKWILCADNTYGSAFNKAIEFAEDGGYIATAPLLIAAMAKVKSKGIWKRFNSPYSERVVSNNEKDKQITVIVHGGGILTPENTINLPVAEISSMALEDLLRGELPSGESIEIYSIEDVKRGNIPYPFGRYGVLIDNKELEKIPNYGLVDFIPVTKEGFLSSPLILATAGTPEYLEAFFDNCGGNITIKTSMGLKVIPGIEVYGISIFWDNQSNFNTGPEFRFGRNVTVPARFFAVNPEAKE